MKINIKNALKDGLNILVKNPIICLIAVIPVISSIILFIFQQFFYSEIFEVGDLPYVLLNYLILLVFCMSFLLFYALVVRMVYVATKKKPMFSEELASVSPLFITLFLASVLYLVIAVTGFILLIIPGIFLMVKLVFYANTVIIDKQGTVSSLKKSWNLTKGNWWMAFILVFLFEVLIPLVVIVPVFIVLSILFIVIKIPENLMIAVLMIVYLLLSLAILLWQISAFTIAYLQLTNESPAPEEDLKEGG